MGFKTVVIEGSRSSFAEGTTDIGSPQLLGQIDQPVPDPSFLGSITCSNLKPTQPARLKTKAANFTAAVSSCFTKTTSFTANMAIKILGIPYSDYLTLFYYIPSSD